MENTTYIEKPSWEPAATFGIESYWASIVSSYHPAAIEFFGTLFVQFLTYWVPAFLFASLDVIAPNFSHRHKIQPIPKQPTSEQKWHAFWIVARNQGLNMLLHIALLTLIMPLRGKQSSYIITPSLPSWKTIAWQFPACCLIREILFWHSHRLLHHPWFYVPIHKFHHRFTAPVALAAQYAHPVEHLFANILPVSTPPQMVGAHIITNWVFLGFVLVETIMVHSGYDFAGGMARMHDLHHERFVGNYGTIGVLDRVYGTYRRKEEKVDGVEEVKTEKRAEKGVKFE